MFRILALAKVDYDAAQGTNVFFMQIKEISASDYHDIARENLALSSRKYLSDELGVCLVMWKVEPKPNKMLIVHFYPKSLKFKIGQNSLL